MKLQASCPYCDETDFDIYDKKKKTLICNKCGEILEIEELDLKIV